MKRNEIIETLKEYNDWRRGADLPQPAPAVIGLAIDNAIHLLEIEPFFAFLRTHRAVAKFKRECKPLKVGMDAQQYIQPNMNKAYWAYLQEKWIIKRNDFSE